MFGLDSAVLIGYGVSALTALVILFAGLILSSWISATIRRVSEQMDVHVDGSLSRPGTGQA